jgi:hypothetical protein
MGGVCKRRYSSGGLSEITPNLFHFTSLKFFEFFNFNPKILKLAIFLIEVSKSGNLNYPLIFAVKLDGNM